MFRSKKQPILAVLAISLVSSLCATAQVPAPQDSPTAASTTEGKRGIARALRLLLQVDASDKDYARTILILVDRTVSVRNSGFERELRMALQRQASQLGTTEFAVEGFGGKDVPGLPPTGDRNALLAAIAAQLDKPDAQFHDPYKALRESSRALSKSKGKRVVLLVTFDNVDVESELEQTVQLMNRAGITVHVLTGESYLSDSYWVDKSYRQAPRGAQLIGSDAAIVDMPWGWLFQSAIANEVSPAGFTTYGLGRLAAGTGGRVFLFTPPSDTGHRCVIYGTCPFCSGDHVQELEVYRDGRMALIAPELGERQAVLRGLASDPWFRAVHRVWNDAARAKLLRSYPGVKFSSNGLTETRARRGSWPSWISTLSFKRNARQADKLRQDAIKLRERFAADIAKLDRRQGSPRQQAIADYTLMSLRLCEINLLIYAAWAREMAPNWTDRKGQEVSGPEVEEIPEGRRPVGVSVRSLSLCHGALPYLRLELPGGEALDQEIRRLETEVQAYRVKHGYSPFAVALHRSGLARFYLTYEGVTSRVKRPRSRSKSPDDPTTTTRGGRPARSGASSGGSTGPTTGGGR